MNNIIDKIDRFNKPQSIRGKIEYGNGSVFFKTTGEVAGFEINYTGAIKAIKKLGDGWNIKIGKRKIIIYSLSQSEFTPLLLTYVGRLTITKCVFVNWDLNQYNADIIFKNERLWSSSNSKWEVDSRKHEEIEQQSTIKKTIKKSII